MARRKNQAGDGFGSSLELRFQYKRVTDKSRHASLWLKVRHVGLFTYIAQLIQRLKTVYGLMIASSRRSDGHLGIQSLESLSLRLGVSPELLEQLSQNTADLYTKAVIPKKSGESRILFPPKEELKRAQRLILDRLLKGIPISEAAFGWVEKRSRVDCIENHIGKKSVYTADIRDFFPSIHHSRVFRLFLERLKCSQEVSSVLTKLTTYQYSLPQGAPTSPQLCNIILKPLDDKFSSLWQKQGAYYSRFGDDIIVSSNHQLREFKRVVGINLERFGLKVNPDKFDDMPHTSRQQVLGLVVNEKPNIPPEEIQEIKNILYKARTTGLEAQNTEGHWDFPAHLAGKITQIKAVNPKIGAKLWSEFREVAA